MNFIFPWILGFDHHPNWRTHIFQGGGPTTNQYMFFLVGSKYDWPVFMFETQIIDLQFGVGVFEKNQLWLIYFGWVYRYHCQISFGRFQCTKPTSWHLHVCVFWPDIQQYPQACQVLESWNQLIHVPNSTLTLHCGMSPSGWIWVSFPWTEPWFVWSASI